jgi:hypothetical protein
MSKSRRASRARARRSTSIERGHATEPAQELATRPDAERALGNDRELAQGYDASCARIESPAAIDRILSLSKPGARVAMVGMKTLPWLWGWPVNCFNLYRARRYLTTYAGLDCPWRLLQERDADLQEVDTALWGSAYLTVGRLASATTQTAIAPMRLLSGKAA